MTVDELKLKFRMTQEMEAEHIERYEVSGQSPSNSIMKRGKR